MRFLLDANVPRSAAQALAAAGHEVVLVQDVMPSAATDEAVAGYALRIGAALVTRDLDFADVRRYPPAARPGIIVLRLDDVGAAADVVAVIRRFVDTGELLTALPGRLAILEGDRVRFRPPRAPGDD